MSLKKTLTLMVFSTLFFSAFSAGVVRAQNKPSFDCQKARSTVEIAICADRDLSDLDNRMAGLFQLAKTVPGVDSKALTANQKAFLKERDDVCGKSRAITECLKERYALRVSQLEAITGTSPAGARSSGPEGRYQDGEDQIVTIQCSKEVCSADYTSVTVTGGYPDGNPNFNLCQFMGSAGRGAVHGGFASGRPVDFIDGEYRMTVLFHDGYLTVEGLGKIRNPSESDFFDFCALNGTFMFGPRFRFIKR
ncbi:MAG: lysozyme inhibitor LprI family protein [Deltaproteobacteria bacterium]|jgi:uncharacterized protein|nr:lysozyme inhibitor LprI family protein [Deltaproteobacteria bacterium]